MATINGKSVKITSSGYLYVGGVRVSDTQCTPLSCPMTDDPDINAYVHQWVFKHWTMTSN